MTILLTPDQQSTLRATNEHVLTPDGENWYHQPYWLHDCGNGKFEQFSYEALPANVKDFILTQRGIKR